MEGRREKAKGRGEGRGERVVFSCFCFVPSAVRQTDWLRWILRALLGPTSLSGSSVTFFLLIPPPPLLYILSFLVDTV